jgi:DNA-binding LacI/PurR family transcriptional regulator
MLLVLVASVAPPKGKPLANNPSKVTVTAMKPFTPLSMVDQLVAHLRGAIARGELSGSMPGIKSLVNTLGVSSNTVIAALDRLESENFLMPQGQGRRSRIVLPEGFVRPTFRVTLLLYEREDLHLNYVAEIQKCLKEEGYVVNLADQSLVELGMKVERVARMANQTKTDAWVIFSAPQGVLEWFVANSAPAFALTGRFRGLPLAATGPSKVEALRAAARRLVELGHLRIVLLQPDNMRKPTLVLPLREILDELESHGIQTGQYNLPDWEQTPDGLRRCLDSLFALTPPTALILDRACDYIAVHQHLVRRGILTPRDVSLICTDDDLAFEWCEPSVSCICWDSKPWVRRIVRWVANVASGKDDRRQSFTKAKFVERDSVGPVTNLRCELTPKIQPPMC